MKKLYSVLFLTALLFLFKSVNAQQASNNSYGLSNADWQKYVNKTNVLLENVDKASFLNYVLISSGDNLNERSYFASYIKAIRVKDRAELEYRVGTGVITTVIGVKAYLSSLQPKYIQLYSEYKKRRVEIINTEDAKNAAKRNAGIGIPPSPFNCGSPCTNPGFESGTGVWDYWSGTACTSPDPCSLVPGFSSSAHVLETVGGFDPIVGAALPLVAPGGGTSSLMIGNGSITGSGASRASISFTVDSNSTNFTYRYAVVLQDPISGHTDPERPYFKAKLRDASGTVLACGDYEVIAKPPIVGFFLAPGTSDVYYRPWTTVFVPLNAYIGQCVTLEFTSSDCALGGHYGYAYIDADCSPSTLLTSSPAVCGGAAVTLTAPSGAATYDWTNTSAGGTTGIVGSSTTASISVNLGGTYQVVMTSVSGVMCTSTLTITVLSSPLNPFANFTSNVVCEDTPSSFTDTSTPTDSATAWNWDFNNDGITDSNTQDPTYTYSAGGTYPVTLIITWGPCNADTTINVSVLPGGVPVITPIATMCSTGSSTTLVETGASGGVWSGTGITNTSTGAFDPATATIGLNQIIYATSGMCGAADTISIDVVASSTPAWTTTSLCANGSPVNLNSFITGTTGGTWSGTGVSDSTFTPAGLSGSIAVTYTVGTTPCIMTSTQNITVSGGTPVINPVSTLCSTGSSTTLVATGPVGGTWSGTGITNPSTGAFDPATATIGANQIIYTTPGVCTEADTISINVVLSASPTWTSTSMCSDGSPVNLNSLITGTTGGTWSGTGVTGTTFDPTGLSGSIAVTYTVGTTPCIMTSTQNITVTPLADATIVSGATIICSDGSAITLAGADPGGVWTGTGITNSATGVFDPATSGSGTFIITYTIAGACGDVDTAIVNVIPGGTPTWAIQPSICEQAPSINLNTLVTGTAGGTWSGPGVTGNTFDPSGLSGNISIVYTVGQGACASSSTLVINVDPISASFAATPNSGMEPLVVDFTNGSSNASSYFWDLGDGTTTSVTDPSNTYLYGDYSVMLIATNASGCQDTSWLSIHVEQISLLTIPNIFTPNGDGTNDIFHAILEYGLSSFEATIYDRWGLKMYEWSNANAGWNGQAKNGSPAPDGTYYYIINAKGVDSKDYLYKGYLQLLREKK